MGAWRSFVLVSFSFALLWGGVTIIPTDETQTSLPNAYLFAWRKAAYDQWVLLGEIDPDLGAAYGELPILWLASGPYRGAFLLPDTLIDREFSWVWVPTFDIDGVPRAYSISFPGGECIALYKSVVVDDMGQSVTWETYYFPAMFQTLMGDGVDSWAFLVTDSATTSFDWNVRMLVIPAFESYGYDAGYYIREVAERFPGFGDVLRAFLEGGGTIYAEGNGGYLLEAYGILPPGTIDLSDRVDGFLPSMMAAVEVVDSSHPLGFVSVTDSIYTVSAPTLPEGYRTILRFSATWDGDDVGKPAAVEISGADALGGRIILMAGVPTAGAIATDDPNQWLWSANALLYAFSHKLLHFRSVHSPVVLPESTHVAPYAIPADDSVTFEVSVHLRNLWDEPIEDLTVTEYKNSYFYYVDCPGGPAPSVSGDEISWFLGSMDAGETRLITYRLRTPAPDDPLTGTIDDYGLTGDNRICPSTGIASYTHGGVSDVDYRYDVWMRVLFNADIVADADLNWKNILGEYFQPFKIFMIFENKERTDALETKYVQYVPIDVPVYWCSAEEIPIVRTPGGRFVDVLRGTADSTEGFPASVEYDMDGDGDPDAWLDFSSIWPRPTSAVLESVYWLNPWSGEYEDIDHDGSRAQDLNGDGVVDVPEPGDMIRAWRLEWDIGIVGGYEWHDPYASWELWIDPPPLLDMAFGAAEHLGLPRGERPDSVRGFFYDNWEWWMEHDSSGNVVYVRFIKMSMGSYEGFRFDPDTSTPTDLDSFEQDWGVIPYPRSEYIVVMNLGGREPTMTSPFPPEEDTLYGKVTYTTIWGKYKTTPIRVSYTYFTPLPNPLQFEYVCQSYEIIDPATGSRLDFLPSGDDAYIDFKVTASTEYSRYWLANVGHDYGEFEYDYTSGGRGWTRTSTVPDGLGDGVFGYIVVTIPKGFGGYEIDLPRTGSGELDWSQIFPEYETLVDTNPYVPTEPFCIEYPFKYELYCPQILIPPALDDDNFDGVDDWEDDFGDRFVSSTGYLHDIFPPGTGEDAESLFELNPWDTSVAIEGDLAHAHPGWCPGADSTYGDDLPEKLGATCITLRAIWHGYGYEGPVKINEGAVLVNEEIFGGSPWVQWTHALLAEAKGNKIALGRNVTPTVVSLYPDTIYLRYRIYDANEPHEFNEDFDPYVTSYGTEDYTVQVHVGGREPASLFVPDHLSRSRVDLVDDATFVSIVPEFPDSLISEAGYTRSVDGAVLTVIVEVQNGSGKTWDDLTCRPDLSELGATEPFFWYGVYPRPFVPAHYDESVGGWVPGDDPRTFHAGWRFNDSEREVLFQLGNPDGSVTIPEVLSSRRVYFVYHFLLDPTLGLGVHRIGFRITGTERDYWDDVGSGTPFELSVPEGMFAVVDWGGVESPSFVIAKASLEELVDTLPGYVDVPTPVEARWSWSQPDPAHFDDGLYSPIAGTFTDSVLVLLPPAEAVEFPPSPSRTDVWLIARAIVDAPAPSDDLLISAHPFVRYTDFMGVERLRRSWASYICARGPQVLPLKRVAEVNGEQVDSTGFFVLLQGDNEVVVNLDAVNAGNDIAVHPKFYVQIGKDAYFDGIDSAYTFSYDPETRTVEIEVGDILPNERRTIPLWLAVPVVNTEDVLELCYAFTAEFYAAEEGFARALEMRKFSETDAETLFYGANLSVSDEDVSVAPEGYQLGDEVAINVKVHFSGNTKFENVPVRLVAEDGSPVCDDQTIPLLSAATADTVYVVTFSHTVSDDYEKLFVLVDPDSAFGEITESDNAAKVELFTGKGKLVRDVVNFPNPFKNYTEFVYTLTRPARSVRVEVYTLRGRLVRSFDCPTTPGYNSVGWDGRDSNGDPIGNGSYVYKLIAEDFDGNKEVVRSVAVRMR